MQTYTGDEAFGIFLLLTLVWVGIAIFVIRMGVLGVTREMRALNKQISYLNGLLYARMKPPQEP